MNGMHYYECIDWIREGWVTGMGAALVRPGTES